MNTLENSGTETSQESIPAKANHKIKLSTLLPLSVFLLIEVLLGIGLTMDPKLVVSPLIGKSVPDFNLQPVQGRKAGLTKGSLIGEVSMVNVFASWCVACRQEHPPVNGAKPEKYSSNSWSQLQGSTTGSRRLAGFSG